MEKNELFPLISIVMPVYNRQQFLDKTLSSILDQTYRPLELILVDNGSEDASVSICRDFQTKNDNDHFRVTVLNESRRGANFARNTGMAEASGDYLIFFDSDDWMYPDCITRIVAQLVANNYPKAMACPFLMVFPDGRKARRPHYCSGDPADQLFDVLVYTHNVCLRRTLPEKTGPWNEQLMRWQDLEFGFRVLQQTDDMVWMTGKPLYEVNFHQKSISANGYRQDHEILYQTLMAIRASIEKLPESSVKYRQQRALCYRITSLASQIWKEGDRVLALKYQNIALMQLPMSMRNRSEVVLRFQYWYEGHGGRGFWRLARVLL